MDHVAIMKKSWGLIPKILSGEKSIESRWYQTKRIPWDRVVTGDKIFFKNSGELIIAKAVVSEVIQFEIESIKNVENIIKKYGSAICLVHNNPQMWERLPKYCVLMKLCNPELIKKPFHINKKGFGGSAAWLSVSDISKIKK
jgi:ASC-1-like (ASCH) protein